MVCDHCDHLYIFSFFMNSLLCFSTALLHLLRPFLYIFVHFKLFFTCLEVIRHNNNIHVKLGSFRIMSASFHTPLELLSHQKRHKSLSQLTHVMFYIYPLQKTLFLYSSACFLMKLGSFRIFSSVMALFALYTHPFEHYFNEVLPQPCIILFYSIP